MLKRDGGPLTGVTVTVLNHPEFGATSWADGGYDLAVNGGSLLMLTLAKEGFLPGAVESAGELAGLVGGGGRGDDPGGRRGDDGVLRNAGILDRPGKRGHRCGRGTRRAALYFPPNVGAFVNQFPLPPQPMMELNIRATEYTVGDNGPAAMPGRTAPDHGVHLRGGTERGRGGDVERGIHATGVCVRG